MNLYVKRTNVFVIKIEFVKINVMICEIDVN